MLMPLYGFLEGDVIGLLVLAHDDDRICDVIERVLSSANVRLAKRSGMRLLYRNELIPNDVLLNKTNIASLDRVDVISPETAAGLSR